MVTESEDSDKDESRASQIGLTDAGDKDAKKRNRGKRNLQPNNKTTPQQDDGCYRTGDDSKDSSARFDAQKQKQ